MWHVTMSFRLLSCHYKTAPYTSHIYVLKLDLLVLPETLYHRDDALLYIAYVMLIWAAPIPADRWHCSLWP